MKNEERDKMLIELERRISDLEQKNVGYGINWTTFSNSNSPFDSEE